MRLLTRLLFAGLLAGTSLAALAEDAAPTPEPEVTIRQEGDATVEEYRLNGVLYAIKVTPRVGPSYFMHRADGTALWMRSDQPDRLLPAWQIFSW
jgi:hypothetical protein